MRSRRVGVWLVVGVALALMAGPAGAVGINIVVEDSGSWQVVNESDPRYNGTPYWDNPYPKGGYGEQNVGDWLFNTNRLDNDAWYLGKNDGSAVLNFYFTDGVSNIKLELEWAGQAEYNIFGYYEWDESDNLKYTQIFSGGDTPGALWINHLPAKFGFYLQYGTNIYHTQTKYNSPSDQYQHFAVFRDPEISNVFYIGIEDIAGGGDKDFNDMVVKFSWEKGGGNVPLPGTMLLLGSGLVGLLAVRHRIRSRR